MKPLLLLPVALLSLSFNQSHSFFSAHTPQSSSDSGAINHKLDGIVNEWPASKFSLDNGTGIQYAVDNNGNDLFLALNIPEFKTQLKMMRTGMSMFIDLKGKKKESDGIEFPVKNGNTDLSNNSIASMRHSRQNDDQPVSDEKRKQDMIAIRQLLALNLVEIKIFGLPGKFPDGQQLMLPGSANIAFSWDTADVMHIEYLIPLTMLGDISSLNQKEISIGWKINAFEIPKQAEGSEGSENASMNQRPPGGGYGGGSGGGYRSGGYGGRGGSGSPEDREKMMEAQKFWTKYTVSLPSEKKAF